MATVRFSLGLVSLVMLGLAGCGEDDVDDISGVTGGAGGTKANGKGGTKSGGEGGTKHQHGEAGASGEGGGAHDGHDGAAGDDGDDHQGHDGAAGHDGDHGSGGSDHHASSGGGSATGGSTHQHDGGEAGESHDGGTHSGGTHAGESHSGGASTGGSHSAGTHTGGSATGGNATGGTGGSAHGGEHDMGGAGMGGEGGMPEHNPAHDHCYDGEPVDARDVLLATPSAPDHFTATNGAIDLPLPIQVLDWMDERVWKPSHDGWHNIRRCKGGTGGSEGSASSSKAMCAHTELIPEHQECSDAQNGYEFLVMHRHMLQALRQAFPQHADLFDGFVHFPFASTDVPTEWQSRFGTGWTANVVNTATKLEDIENHVNEFATEGDLGKYIQCGMTGVTSIHAAMHFKWVVSESPNSLGKQSVNLGNFMFWKLHGWIDGIWERYRVAKGLPPDEQKLKDALVGQCIEMHTLAGLIEPEEPDPDPLPVEHGYFHEKVRPAFERLCVGCHSETSPEANQTLAGHISSADIVANLVNVQSSHGGQYYRIVPGQPYESWTYLKAAALAADVGCVGDTCNTQSMPPGATDDQRLTTEELGFLEQWILDGAPAPTAD